MSAPGRRDPTDLQPSGCFDRRVVRKLPTHGFLTVPRRMFADSIDVRGDPLSDMSVLTGAFAMKDERVYKQPR